MPEQQSSVGLRPAAGQEARPSWVSGSTEGCHHKGFVLMKPEEQSQQQRWFGALAWSSPPDPSMRAGAREHLEDSLKQHQAHGTWQKRQHTTARQCHAPQLILPSLWHGVQPHLRGHRGSHLATAAVLTAHRAEEEESPPLQCRHPVPSQHNHFTPGS